MPNYVTVYSKGDSFYRNGLWVDERGTPITGIRKTFYPSSGTVQDETTIVDGIVNGIQKVYDGSGTLWYENTWKNNVMVSFKKV